MINMLTVLCTRGALNLHSWCPDITDSKALFSFLGRDTFLTKTKTESLSLFSFSGWVYFSDEHIIIPHAIFHDSSGCVVFIINTIAVVDA